MHGRVGPRRRFAKGLVALVLALAVVGCDRPTATEQVVPATPSASPIQAPTPTPQAVASPNSSPAVASWVSRQDGARLEMRATTDSVEAGKTATFIVSLTNERDTPLQFGWERGDCFTFAYVQAFLPLDPVGRTDWTGEAAAFKERILSGTGGPPEHPYVEELSTGERLVDTDCVELDGIAQPLAPGQTISATFNWTASFGDALPVAPPSATFRALAFVSNRATLVTPAPPPTDFPSGRWASGFKELWVTGTVGIIGETRPMASLGQIVDSALANETFHVFITEHPVSGCLVSLILPSEQGRYLPAGPGWNLEENCLDQHRFIRAEIDPWTAEVKGLDVCNLCGR